MSSMIKVFAAAAMCASLTACYVMPVNPQTGYNYGGYNAPNSGVAIVPVAAIRPPYTARLYPSNEAAARQGQVSGMITNPERGHGEFSFAMGGETFRGEATRAPNSTKGVANAAGSRGGYVRCDYTMSSAELGSGVCQFSQGARYDMHISQ